MSQFQFIVTDTQATGVYRGNLTDLDAYGVRLTTILPGGCGEATLYIPASWPPTIPQILGFNFDVRVLDGADVLWRGRMEKIGYNKRQHAFMVILRGYGVNLADQVYSSQNVQNVQTSQIVSDAITTLAPQISALSVTATGFTISNTAAVNLRLLNAAAVIAWARRYGDSGYAPQILTVYPDRDGTVRVTYADRPTTVDLEGYLEDFETAEFVMDGQQLANRATVQYNSSGDAFATVNDTALQGAGPAGWNLIKTAVAVLPEITQSVDASQAANAILTAAKSQLMNARSLEAAANRYRPRVYDSNGANVPAWWIRAGQLMHLRDLIAADGEMGRLTWNNSFVIAETVYDEDRATLTIRPESFESTLERFGAKIYGMLAGRHQVG